jgi:glycosyltransferase involved in cell wall biosynthesis
MKFSIITPSFRNSDWLKLCIASVADQQGVAVEHIVQDSCSDDGTQDWLPQDSRVQACIEKDTGMYDAVNRGYRRATGDILAYLNCDEQYLPGALARMEKFFAANPQIEVVFAGAIVTDGAGKYLCHRHALLPVPRYAIYKFSVLTAATFIRRKVIHERGIVFDTRWRALGDYYWVLELLKQKVPVAVLDDFTSTFTDNGENLCLSPTGKKELAETIAAAPRWVRLLKPVWTGHHRLRRLVAGHFSIKPTRYEIFTPASQDRRLHFAVPKPTAVWRSRL